MELSFFVELGFFVELSFFSIWSGAKLYYYDVTRLSFF